MKLPQIGKSLKPKTLRKPSARAKEAAARLFERVAFLLEHMPEIRRVDYANKWGMRVPVTYTVFRSGKMCRHRERGQCNCVSGLPTKIHTRTCAVHTRGPLCGDVWELATYDLRTDKLIRVICYMHSHGKKAK